MSATVSDEDREKARQLWTFIRQHSYAEPRGWVTEKTILNGIAERLADAKAAEREKWWKAGIKEGQLLVLNDVVAAQEQSLLEIWTETAWQRVKHGGLPIEPLPTPEQGEKP